MAKRIDTAALRRLYPDDPILEAVFDTLDGKVAGSRWVQQIEEQLEALGVMNGVETEDWRVDDFAVSQERDFVDATMFGSPQKSYLAGTGLSITANVRIRGHVRGPQRSFP